MLLDFDFRQGTEGAAWNLYKNSPGRIVPGRLSQKRTSWGHRGEDVLPGKVEGRREDG